MFKTLKEFFVNTADTLRDKRFSWRFKICNIITNDWLRQNTAFASARLSNSLEHIRLYLEDRDDEPDVKVYAAVIGSVKRDLIKARQDIRDCWHM